MPKHARPTSYTGSQSNQDQTGDTRAANSIEALNPLIDNLYMSPKTMAQANTVTLSSPGPIGNVTPSTAAFSTVNTTQGITGRQLFANGDITTGTIATTSLTNVVNTTQGLGTLRVASSSANAGNNAGFLKIYVGTTIAYVPYFTNITP